MALGVEHAFLRDVPGLRRPGEQRRGDLAARGLAVAGHDQLEPLEQPQAAAGALEMDQGLGKGVGIEPAGVAAIDDAGGAAAMAQHHGRHILAADPRLDRLRLAIERLDLAEEHPGDVEDVDAEIEDDELLLGGEVGLVGVDVIGGAERDAAEMDLADGAAGQRLADRQHRRLEAEILVHHQGHAGGAAGLDHGDAVPPARREGLLHDRGHLVAGSELDQRAVRRHGGDDIDEVEPLLGEHPGGVAVGPGNAEALLRGLRLGLVAVAHRDELDAGDVAPGVEVVLGEEAAADQAAAQRAVGSHGRIPWGQLWPRTACGT